MPKTKEVQPKGQYIRKKRQNLPRRDSIYCFLRKLLTQHIYLSPLLLRLALGWRERFNKRRHGMENYAAPDSLGIYYFDLSTKYPHFQFILFYIHGSCGFFLILYLQFWLYLIFSKAFSWVCCMDFFFFLGGGCCMQLL